MIIQALVRFFLIFLFINFGNAIAKEKISIFEQESSINIEIKLDEEDTIYWYKKLKLGLPTEITIENSFNLKNFHLAWPWPNFKTESHYTYAYYKDKVIIPIFLEPLDKQKQINFIAKISYLLCNNEGCTQKTQSLPFSTNPSQINQKETSKFQYNAFIKGKELHISSPNNSETILLLKERVYMPISTSSDKNDSYSIFLIDNSLKENDKIEVINSTLGQLQDLTLGAIKHQEENNFTIIYYLYALLGGFILNFMPCVLPILSLKLNFLIKNSDRRLIRMDASISIITIIFYFLLMGLITISTKNVGKFFTPGLALQAPHIIIFCLLLVVASISIIRDKFTFNPVPTILQINNLNTKYLNTILSTITSTILATPCTAPFLATSMTFALSQKTETIFLMFLLSAIGFSIPYFVIILNPELLKYLPRSGKWQNYFKNFFLLLLVLTTTWLLYILNSLLGTYASISIFLLLYLFRFVLEINSKSTLRSLGFICIFASLFYIPFSISNNFKNLDQKYEKLWDEFSYEKLNQHINNDEIILVNATADWCATCKVNKFFVFDRPDIKIYLIENKIKLLEADITKTNDEAQKYLHAENSPGIPFSKIYGPNNKQGIVLPVMLRSNDIINTIERIKNKEKQ